jgi:predicted dehydrogenase
MNRRDFMKQSAALGAAASVAPVTFGSTFAPSDHIALGIIGSGARAQQLMGAIKHIPGVDIVAVCDAYKGRAKRAQARTGGRAAIYQDYKEILAKSDIDTVVIGAPDHWHKQMALEALAAGKDVYIEKPMTYTVDEGLEIINAVRSKQRVLQVGSQGMSSRTEQMAHKLIKEGRLGQVTFIRASFNRNSAGGAWIYPIPPDANEDTVNWKAFLGPAPKRAFSLERFFRWRCYWDYSGGIATDLFVHLVNSIHYMMDAEMPSTVMASGELYRWKDSREVPDTLNAILVYPEGFTANLSSTFNNQSASESGFEILGTEGSLAFRGGQLQFYPENVYEDNRWVVESWEENLEKAYYNNPKVQEQETPSTWKPTMKPAGEIWEEWGMESTYTHMLNFFECVRTRNQPVEGPAKGHHAAACAHMVNRSLQDGAAVEWDFSKKNLKA